MSATEALDAYLERQLAAGGAGTGSAKQPASKGSSAAAHNLSKGSSSKENRGQQRIDGTSAQQPVKRRPAWPPSPLEAQEHAVHSAHAKAQAKKPSSQALQRLKQQAGGSRGATMQPCMGQEAAEHPKAQQPPPADAAPASAAQRAAEPAEVLPTAGAGRQAPKQAAARRTACWDSSADEEALRALGIMDRSSAGPREGSASARQLPMHAASEAGQHPALAAGAATGRQGMAAHVPGAAAVDQEGGAVSGAGKGGAAAQHASQSQDDSEAAQVLEELLAELRAAEEAGEQLGRARSGMAPGSRAGARSGGRSHAAPDSCLEAAAREESGGLGAAVSLYKGVQEQQTRAERPRSAPLLALPGPVGGRWEAAAQLPRRREAPAAEEPLLAPVRRILEAFDAEAPIQAPLPPIGDAEDGADAGSDCAAPQAGGSSAAEDATPAAGAEAAAASGEWLTGPGDSPVRMPRLSPAPPSPVRPPLRMSLQQAEAGRAPEGKDEGAAVHAKEDQGPPSLPAPAPKLHAREGSDDLLRDLDALRAKWQSFCDASTQSQDAQQPQVHAAAQTPAQAEHAAHQPHARRPALQPVQPCSVPEPHNGRFRRGASKQQQQGGSRGTTQQPKKGGEHDAVAGDRGAMLWARTPQSLARRPDPAAQQPAQLERTSPSSEDACSPMEREMHAAGRWAALEEAAASSGPGGFPEAAEIDAVLEEAVLEALNELESLSSPPQPQQLPGSCRQLPRSRPVVDEQQFAAELWAHACAAAQEAVENPTAPNALDELAAQCMSLFEKSQAQQEGSLAELVALGDEQLVCQ